MSDIALAAAIAVPVTAWEIWIIGRCVRDICRDRAGRSFLLNWVAGTAVLWSVLCVVPAMIGALIIMVQQ